MMSSECLVARLGGGKSIFKEVGEGEEVKVKVNLSGSSEQCVAIYAAYLVPWNRTKKSNERDLVQKKGGETGWLIFGCVTPLRLLE